MRHPRHHGERAANADPMVKPYVRPKRRPNNLVCDRADLFPSKGRKPRYKDHRR